MFASAISVPHTIDFKAEEFDRRADEYAELAEEASGFQECIRYRDLERDFRIKATAERLGQIAHLYSPANSSGVAA